MMNTSMLFLILAGVINVSLLVTAIIYSIMLSRRPKMDRSIVTGVIIEVFKGGKGLRVSYDYEGKPYTALQINQGVNRLPSPPAVGSPVQVHVNPFRPSNITLTPRPVRDEKGFVGLMLSVFASLLISSLLLIVLL